MSSSAESADHGLGWDCFSERPAGPAAEFASPGSELAAVLQRYRADVDAARSQTRDAVDDAREAAARQAVLVAQLDSILGRVEVALTEAGHAPVHRRLRVLKDQMLDGLRRDGITVADPSGRPLAEVQDRVEVVGWRHVPELSEDLVVVMIEPIVLYRQTPIRRGQVIAGTSTFARTPTREDEE